jgi:hydroxyacylglutathione hydrolase
MSRFVEVAPGLSRLALLPFDLLNVYLMGDVLIDAGGRFAVPRLVRALDGRRVSAHALTHAHFDHQGGSHGICERLDIPLLCGERDREAVETGDLTRVARDPASFVARLNDRLGGPAHPVARTLGEGDGVADFTVLETPGHTPGHLAFWRERDQVLVVGDVLFHRNPTTGRLGLAEPYRLLAWDHALNRAVVRRLTEMEPAVICFGHGPPLRDPDTLHAFVDGLPVG